MIFLISILFALMMLAVFIREKFPLSPTAIFMAYSALVLPISYCVTINLNIGSVFFEVPILIEPDIIFKSYLALGISLVFFAIAQRIGKLYTFSPSQPKRLIERRFLPLTFVAVLLAFLSAYGLILELGGIVRIVEELGAVRSGELVGKGVQVYAITMLLPTVLQWHLIAAIRSKKPYASRVFWLCILASLAGATFGFRAPAVALIIQTVVIRYLLTRTPSKRALIIVISLFLPLATLAGFARFFANDAVVKTLEQVDLSTLFGYFANTTITRVRGIETFSIMVSYINETEYHWFWHNILESILSVIPTFIIEKPTSVTETIATQVYSRYLFEAGILKEIYGGVSYTFISEGYWNAGMIGVALYGAGLGLFFAFAERAERNPTPTNMQIILYKATAGFCPLLVEATQLGVNAILMNVFVNVIIVTLLSLRITPAVMHRSPHTERARV